MADDSIRGFHMLEGTRVLLVGGSGDIGLAMSRRFLAEGATLIATGNSHPEGLQALAAEAGDRLRLQTMDVTSLDSIQGAYDSVTAEGGLDALVYNAGIIRDGPTLGIEEEDWLKVIDVNLNGAFRVAKVFGRIFFRQRRGRMLFVSSVAGQRGGRGQANYASSKAGLEGFVRSLAADMAPRGILVNAIAPGPVESRMTRDVMNVAGDEVLRKIALKRLAQPEEVASLAAHLLAPDLTYLTGQVVAIDGGFQ